MQQTNKQKKEFEHELIEVCKISHKDINTYDERYVILLDCDGEQITNMGFYKSGRLKDLMKGNGEIIKTDLVDRYKGVVGSMINQLRGIPA